MSEVKVTLNPTPSQEAVAKMSATVKVTDARGRVITLKKPGVLAQYRLVDTCGDSSRNDGYMAMVLPLIYVAEIEGDAVLPLGKRSEIDALIQRLDYDGIEAIMAGVRDNWGQSDPEADKAEIKK